MKKPAPHTRQYYLVRWKPHQRYTLERIAPTGAECIPVMGYIPARQKQKELNATLPAKRNGWKPGERPAGSGRKKLEDPTAPVTIRLRKSVLDRLPGDVYERNAAIVAAVENVVKNLPPALDCDENGLTESDYYHGITHPNG